MWKGEFTERHVAVKKENVGVCVIGITTTWTEVQVGLGTQADDKAVPSCCFDQLGTRHVAWTRDSEEQHTAAQNLSVGVCAAWKIMI